MNLKIDLLKKEEIELFKQIHDLSFEVHAKYFKDGVLPEHPEDDEEYELDTLIDKSDYIVLGIYDGQTLIGGATVQSLENYEYEIYEIFIAVEYQSKGIGKNALEQVENYFEDAKVFRLITPSQVIRNTVFYVNKCGYHIVKVVDFNKEENCADYVFEKRK